MRIADACTHLNVNLRQLQYLLQSEGVPAGERTERGELTEAATTAFYAILARRQSSVQCGAKPVQLSSGDPISTPATPVGDNLRTELNATRLQLYDVREELYHARQELRRLSVYVDGADDLLGRMCEQITELQAQSRQVPFLARLWASVADKRQEAVAVRREYVPALFVGESNVLRRA